MLLFKGGPEGEIAKEERIIIVPTAGTNEKWINQALSETLNKLLTDSELLAFLAKP